MIALTQEMREELNTFINASIEQRCTVYTLKKQRELEELRDQIALASLTADQVGWGLRSLQDSGRFGSWITTMPRQQSYLNYQPHAYENVPLYTAPPVPEIKLPELLVLNEDSNEDYKDGFLDAVTLIKRLNGLGE